MEQSSINLAFSRVLRRLRKSKFLSQEDLALKSGLHRNYISALERQLKSPTLVTLFKISSVLQIPLSSLFLLVETEAQSSL